MELKGEVAKEKARWDRRDRDFTPEGEEVTLEDPESKKSKEELVQENEHREPYNHRTKTLDFRGIRPTDVKNCPRVKLSGPRSQREEMELGTKHKVMLKNTKEYIRTLEEQPDNLTKSERRGLRKLKKRVDAGEIVIVQSDKSNRLCVMSVEAYRMMGTPHIQNDPEASWEEVSEAQQEIKGHLRAINCIFSAGEETNQERVWSAKELRSTTIPVLKMLAKDHKKVDADGLPPGRPVCGASFSINGEVSHYTVDVLGALAAADTTEEVCSSEELLAFVDEVVEKLDQSEEEVDMCIGSLDVKALYP